MKRILYISCLLVLFQFIPDRLFAYDFEADGFCFNKLSGNTCSVAPKYPEYEGDIVIPEKVVYNEEEYTVTEIGMEAFANCTMVTTLTMPNTITRLQSGCLLRAGVKNIVFSENLEYIGKGACAGLYNLEGLTLPSKLKYLDQGAFEGCEKLTEIYIPASVEAMDGSAFANDNLMSLTVDPESQFYCSVDGVVYSKDKKVLVSFPAGREGVFSVPDYVVHIGSASFNMGHKLTEVNLPSGLEEIGKSAFNQCINLKTATIPDKVKDLPDGVFCNCENLEMVHIGAGVETILKNCFMGCSKLKAFYVSPNNPSFLSIDGILFNKDGTEIFLLPNGFEGTVNIPSSMTRIVSMTFSMCQGLIEVNVPETVTVIEDFSFNACRNLQQINVAPGNPAYASVDGVLFDKSMETLLLYPLGKVGEAYVVPESVKTIGVCAFEGNDKLTSITLNLSLKTIKKFAFSDCRTIAEIVVPDSVTTIEEYAFRGIYVTSVKLGRGLKTLSKGVFGSAYGFKDFFIPNNVERIEDFALDCGHFETITIGEGVDWVGYSFSEGEGLKEIRMLGTTPPYLDKGEYVAPQLFLEPSYGGFSLQNFDEVKLVVPASALELYRNARGWKQFKHIVASHYDTVYAQALTLDTVRPASLVICLDNLNEFSACKMDVVLPEGLIFNVQSDTSVRMDKNRDKGHRIILHQKNIKELTLAVYNVNGTPFSGDSGDFLHIPIKALSPVDADTKIKISNLVFTTSMAQDVPLRELELDVVVIINAEGVTLNQTELTLSVGATDTLIATVLPENATDKTVVWTTSDETVATVADGVVTAVGVGSATITATCGEVFATCAVIVTEPEPPVVEAESIMLDKTEIELPVGETETLTATVLPEDATDKTVVWASSDEAVATVVEGVITAIAVGSATITATCGDVSATCVVTVTSGTVDNEDNPFTGIRVYPNPSDGRFTVEVGTCPVHAEIYDANGALLCAYDWVDCGKQTEDLSGRPAGIYYLRLTANGAVKTVKLVVR